MPGEMENHLRRHKFNKPKYEVVLYCLSSVAQEGSDHDCKG